MKNGGGGGEAGKTAHLRAKTSANRVGTVVSEFTRNIIASATKHHHSKTHTHTHNLHSATTAAVACHSNNNKTNNNIYTSMT